VKPSFKQPLYHHSQTKPLENTISFCFSSPVMAGGLFAIDRKWFWDLGGYDPGLDIQNLAVSRAYGGRPLFSHRPYI